MTFYELRDLHPRVAHWLDQEGLLYIHEYRSRYGQIDFVSIHPSSGHVAIIEAKVQLTAGCARQVIEYRKAFGVPDASLLMFSLLPISDDDMNELEKRDIEAFYLSMDYPAARIRPFSETAESFVDVYEDFHDYPMQGRYPYIQRLAHTFYEFYGLESQS